MRIPLFLFTMAAAFAAETGHAPVTQQTSGASKGVLDQDIIIGTGHSISVSGGTSAGFGGNWGSITGALSSQSDLAAALAGKQPLDSDLTAIAALTTTSFGRATLSLVDAAAGRGYFGVVIGTNVQAWSANLDDLSAHPGSYYLARANHTGTQLAATISDFATAVQTFANVHTVAGRTGDVVLASSDVSGLVASATTDTTNASNISAGTLAVARGGTGAGAFTAHGVLLGEGTSAVASTSAGTLYQSMVSNGSGSDPTFQAVHLDQAAATTGLLSSAKVDYTSATLSGLTSISAGALILSSSAFNAQTGTSYTLAASDNGKIVTLNNASAITLTVPAGLGAGFSCIIIQLGAGQVTVSPSSTTIHNAYSNTKLVGQYAVATLTAYVANTFLLTGDTSL